MPEEAVWKSRQRLEMVGQWGRQVWEKEREFAPMLQAMWRSRQRLETRLGQWGKQVWAEEKKFAPMPSTHEYLGFHVLH